MRFFDKSLFSIVEYSVHDFGAALKKCINRSTIFHHYYTFIY